PSSSFLQASMSPSNPGRDKVQETGERLMEHLLLTTAEAAERLRIGKSTLYDLIRSRRLRTVKIGKRRLVPVDALPEVIALLVEEESAA
ncbi:helix-turn-helix domain-containing protein, partial [Actinopolymorpha pittospori]